MTKICDLCGKEFRNRGVGQGRTRRFCSNECRLAHLNALPRARKPEGVFFSAQTTPRGYIRGQIWRDGKVINIMEHRWVMEQHLGRRLTAKERVHHINGNRTDNRIENLELFASQGEHLRHCHDHEIRENLEKARVGYLAFLSNSQSSTA